jgi:predicted RNA-binding Zn-ribbon protein involved in translation (DUF1610 family)
MGRTYLFECPKCGYRAKVAGGADQGLHFAVQTLLCYECRELHDAVTALKTVTPGLAMMPDGSLPARTRSASRSPPTFVAALNRLPPSAKQRPRWVQFKPVCPVSARHRVREWQTPDKCPKCGCYLERNALPFRLWD